MNPFFKPPATPLAAAMLALVALGLLPGAESLENRQKAAPAGVKPLEATGIHNLYALGTNVFSGSTPEGAKGFDALARLGVRTIISVDGAKPDVEAARKRGMRYVHLPHGYDGISTNLQQLLAKAGRELAGPIYVHCHHGKHRGPAAAAVICLADQGWTSQQAEAFLVAAGTSTNYAGLYDAVRKFQLPTIEQLQSIRATYPETAQVSGLVDAMVGVDERWELLKAVRAAGYQAPKEHPDVVPANETVVLWEHYREAQRLPETIQHGTDMVDRFKAAEAEAKEAERLLRRFGPGGNADVKARLDKTFDALARTCSNCHQAFRDHRQP